MDTPRPIVFGEVLFDHFPDGTRVLGGAPFNVAWHLQGLGARPLFVSAVGEDPEGQVVRRSMRDWGMDLSGLQTDPVHPTGAVRVAFEDGQPRFHILDQQAYDHVDPETAEAAVAAISPALLYHGTLALRHRASRETFRRLAARVPARFVDLNLRAPWWNEERIQQALEGARWVKLNDEELRTLSGLEDLDQAAQTLRRRWSLRWLILTLGADGARLYTEDGPPLAGTPPRVTVVDTVGAGDAFSAVTLLGLLRHWPPQQLLQRALEFAAAVCTLRGATTADPDFYRPFRERWTST